MEKLSIPQPPSTAPAASADFGSSGYRRLYLQDGMIPKYTGYIPRKLLSDQIHSTERKQIIFKV